MKRLRNIGIYYTVLGIVLMFTYAFQSLWRISLLGIFLLVIYLLLNVIYHKKKITTSLTNKQLKIWDLILILSPCIYLGVIFWYVLGSYKQSIILPKNYEGVVAIQYKKPKGQSKEWTGGFLGIGASRLIKIDSSGVTETQFNFNQGSIPFLGMDQTYYDREGTKVFYEDDLDNEIMKGFDGEYRAVDNIEKPRIYFTGQVKYPLIIFVVTKPENYNNYFLDENTKQILREQNNKTLHEYLQPGKHYLNKRYNYYYKLKDYYLKN